MVCISWVEFYYLIGCKDCCVEGWEYEYWDFYMVYRYFWVMCCFGVVIRCKDLVVELGVG